MSTGIISLVDLPRDLREWNRVFAPLNQALQRVQVSGSTEVVSNFAGKITLQVNGSEIGADYALNLISGDRISLSGSTGGDSVDVTVSLDTLLDSDIPASIARDTEVSAAVSAAQSAAQSYADSAIATAVTALNLDSGSYTPTLTNVSNLDSSVAFQCQYLRVGSVVTVSGKVDVDPTATGIAVLGISLPIASDFGSAEDCGGCAGPSAVGGEAAAILADSTNNRAQFQFVAANTANHSFFFTFAYRII